MSTLRPGDSEVNDLVTAVAEGRRVVRTTRAGDVEMYSKGRGGRLDKVIIRRYNQRTARSGEGQLHTDT